MKQLEIKENSNRIDRKCVERGISRRELARRSGVPIRTLEDWSHRINIPRDVYQLLKVAKALDCAIEDLIEPEVAETAARAKEAKKSPEE